MESLETGIENNKRSLEILRDVENACKALASIGFIMVVIANFLDFAPIDSRTWREIGVGFPVLLASVAGIAFLYKRSFFSSFFIAMFAAFFITHEIIICYDNKAVEMGRELGPEGWFRPVAMIFQDALGQSYGAFWATAGSSLAIFAIIIGWMLAVYHDNLLAAKTEAGQAFETPEIIAANVSAVEATEADDEIESGKEAEEEFEEESEDAQA